MSKLSEAFALAAEIHAGRTKNGTSIPFIYHPMAVASLVLGHGGSEDQAIGALLHDAIGDSRATQLELESRFGERVVRFAFAFADPEPPHGHSPSWRESKLAYLNKVSSQDSDTLLLIACEELHEGSELLHDLKHYGWRTWERYSVAPGEVVWYFDSLHKVFEQKLARAQGALVAEFRDMVEGLRPQAA